MRFAQRGAGHHAMLAAILIAIAIGLTFPDIDQPLALGHRSAITHAVWAPLGAACWPRLRAAAGGLAIGIAVHLAADLFPRSMTGYATIHVPFAGSLGMWSYLWIALHAVAAMGLGIALLRPHLPRIWSSGAALVLAVLIALDYLAGDAAALPALLLVIGCGWLVLRRERARRITFGDRE